MLQKTNQCCSCGSITSKKKRANGRESDAIRDRGSGASQIGLFSFSLSAFLFFPRPSPSYHDYSTLPASCCSRRNPSLEREKKETILSYKKIPLLVYSAQNKRSKPITPHLSETPEFSISIHPDDFEETQRLRRHCYRHRVLPGLHLPGRSTDSSIIPAQRIGDAIRADARPGDVYANGAPAQSV